MTPFDLGGMPLTSGLGFLDSHAVVLTPSAPALQPLADAMIKALDRHRGQPSIILNIHTQATDPHQVAQLTVRELDRLLERRMS